jgi:predicted neuraminidase
MFRTISVVLVLLVCTAGAIASKPPRIHGKSPGHEAVPVRLPDGSLRIYFFQGQDETEEREEIASISSTDGGVSWSKPETVLKTPGRHWVVSPLVAKDGAIHLFFLKWREEKTFLDVWHTRSSAAGDNWEEPKLIFKGRVGSLRSAIQLGSGRIVLPLHYRVDRSWSKRGEGMDSFLYKGQANVTTAYSDDNGATWKLSPAALKAPAGSIPTYGAAEPVLIELRDGRVWMLIRTQRGRLYESFSRDGVEWTEPRPSQLISSDSPAALTRLHDGRIVLFWNACQRFPYAIGGRQVLHGAISNDEGKTWQGMREVYRDPTRDQPPPRGGDFGTSYAAAVETSMGHLLLATGQGDAKALLSIDPEWFMEKRQSDDFAGALDAWSVFGTDGVDLITHPKNRNARVLSMKAPKDDWTSGAVWNFPAGQSGRLRLRVFPKKGFDGTDISLTDEFSPPFDEEGELAAIYTFQIAGAVNVGKWNTLEFEWSQRKRNCRVSVNGKQVALIPEQRQTVSGVGYLRLKYASDGKSGALLIERVDATVL